MKGMRRRGVLVLVGITVATLWLGAIGFLDDYLRVVKGLPKGLLGRYKLAGQVAIGLAVGLAVLELAVEHARLHVHRTRHRPPWLRLTLRLRPRGRHVHLGWHLQHRRELRR